MSEFNVNFNLVNSNPINGNFVLSAEEEDLIASFLLDSSDSINGLFTVDSVSAINATFVYGTSPNINAIFKIDYYPMILSQLDNDANYVQDANYIHTDNNFTDNEQTLVGLIVDSGYGTMYLSDDGTYKTVEGGVTSVNGEVGDVVLDIPTALSDLTNDSTHRLVTDTQIGYWNGKADKVVITNKIFNAYGHIVSQIVNGILKTAVYTNGVITSWI